MFKYGDIQNISFTPDKELNILIYRTPSCVITRKSYTLLKMVQFFLAHPVHVPTFAIFSLSAKGQVRMSSTLHKSYYFINDKKSIK